VSEAPPPSAEAPELADSAPAPVDAEHAAKRLRRFDVGMLVGLTVAAFLLRILSPIMPDFVSNPTAWPPVRAYGLGHPFQAPNGYIFDEVYFAQDACRDLVGMDYFDPEPPLAKLAIAGGMVIGGTWMHYDQGYQPNTTPDQNGVVKDNRCEADGTLPGFGTWGWRLTSLFFGTLVIPLVYLLALRLWPNRLFAFSAALLVTLDGMFFVQSRIAMIDMVAEFLLILTYYLFLVHRDARTDRRWWVTLLLLGTSIGLAVSSKWTTLAAVGTIMVFLVGGWALRWWRERNGDDAPGERPPLVGARDFIARPIFYFLALFALPGMIYVLSYARYNTIPHCAGKDANGLEVPAPCAAGSSPATPLRIQRVEAGPVAVWVPTGVDPNAYINNIRIHDEWAYDYHSKLTATHPYGSRWFSWPLLLRPVAYYYQDSLGTAQVCPSPGAQPGVVSNGQLTTAPPNCTLRAEVFNLGNPAIWWFSIPAVIFCAFYAVRRRSWPAALIVVAFLAAWLPFSRVNRVMFLYHMFGGLPFMILAVSFSLGHLGGWVKHVRLGEMALPAIRGSQLAAAYLGLVVLTFVYLYPLWSALPITGDSWTQRIWFNTPSDFHVPLLPNDVKISWV
jgi:dolichyl-phosphate-mannose--protein O-mannosyl transferase